MRTLCRFTFPLRWNVASSLKTNAAEKCNLLCLGAYDYKIRHSVVCRLGEEPVPVVGSMAWTVNGASTHARQLLAVFQVHCVGYAQNSLEFVPRSPLIHMVGRSFCLYTDSLFAQIGDSNDKCSSWLEVECLNEDETHAAQQSPTQFYRTHERKKSYAA
jgi:hypothetical protein